jgi:hypothetical protein
MGLPFTGPRTRGPGWTEGRTERKRCKEKDGRKDAPLMLDQRIRRQGRSCMLHVFFLISPKFLTGIARGLEEFLRAALVVRLSLGLLFFYCKYMMRKK